MLQNHNKNSKNSIHYQIKLLRQGIIFLNFQYNTYIITSFKKFSWLAKILSNYEAAKLTKYTPQQLLG
jgi:hypothetical protein